MILGNPYKFAIFLQMIKEWNIDKTFCNGVLLFSVNGIIFPNQILTASLNCEISLLKENLNNIAVNVDIFNMKKENAYRYIYNRTFPENMNLDNDYQFDITPLSFLEDSCYIFAVSNGIQVRVLAAKLEYNKKESRHKIKNIYEAFISVEEVKEIAKNLNVD